MSSHRDPLQPLTTRPFPSPQHGRCSTPSSPAAPSPSSPQAEDWWRWPTPTKEDATGKRPFVEIGARGRAAGQGGAVAEDGGGRVKMLGEWRIGSTIGKGTNGRVRLARSTKSGEFAAVKKVKRLPPSHKHAEVIDREISMMKVVEHPHILQLKDVFETPNHFFLVTDYCPHGEVFHYLVSHNLSPDTIYRWFAQLISALLQLNLLGIAHRDIKFENLFLFQDADGGLSIKLGDLGMASYQPEGQLLETSCGSPHYAAPEVILGVPYDGAAADVWSSGVVLYALFARQLPFDHDNIPSLLAMIKRGHYEMHDSITGEARDLIQRMLVKDVEMRIPLTEISEHPYVADRRGSFDIVEPTLGSSGEPFGALLSRNDLEEDVLANLRIVLRVDSVEEVANMVLYGRQASRAKQFYSTLHRFKTKMTVLSDEPTVRYSKQARRSISLPDFPLPPRPASLMLAPSKEQPTHRSSRLPSRKKLSIIPEPESAPAATCDFPFPTIAVEPSSRRQSRRAAAQTLDTEEPQDVLSAPAQFVEFSNLFDPPSAQLTALSLPSAVDFRSSTPSLLEEDQSSQRSVRRKKSSMQRIRSLFRRDESTSEGAETVVPLLSAPVAEAVQPASPLRDSFLKRSTGYSSLHKAIVGLAPGSPSPARASYVPSELGLPRAPSHTPQRKKSWLSRRSQVIEQEVAAQPTTSNDENVQQALQQLVGGASPMPSPVPSPTKRRPSPLNLVSSNLLGKSTSSTTSSSSPRPQAGLFTSRSGKRMLIAADADSGLLSPRSPLSDSSNEQDPFFLGSPFQPRPKQQQQQPITPPPRRQLSKAMRIQQLEDENAALLLEISLLKLTLLLKAAEMDSLEREKREVEREKEALWSKLEERRSVEAGEGELRRLSFGEEEGSEEEGGKRDSELSERLEERWLKMLGIEAGVVEGEP